MDYLVVSNISKYFYEPKFVSIVRKCLNIFYQKEEENEIILEIHIRNKNYKIKNDILFKMFFIRCEYLDDEKSIDTKCYCCKKEIYHFNDFYIITGIIKTFDDYLSEVISYCSKCYKQGLYNFYNKNGRYFYYINDRRNLKLYQEKVSHKILKNIEFPKIYFDVGLILYNFIK